jgi:N-acetylglutamate synthase-like GNAT family acetyltransferase
MVSIIPYSREYASDFKQLNIEWLQQYFTVEPYDEYQLSNPQHEIIDKGGFIFMALARDEVIGTVALKKESMVSYELTKMSVTKTWQGRGVSKLLMDACIVKAKEEKLGRLFLYSNTLLATAIALYRKYGFLEIPLEPGSQYQRTNIKMELIIGNR